MAESRHLIKPEAYSHLITSITPGLNMHSYHIDAVARPD